MLLPLGSIRAYLASDDLSAMQHSHDSVRTTTPPISAVLTAQIGLNCAERRALTGRRVGQVWRDEQGAFALARADAAGSVGRHGLYVRTYGIMSRFEIMIRPRGSELHHQTIIVWQCLLNEAVTTSLIAMAIDRYACLYGILRTDVEDGRLAGEGE